MWWSSAHSKSFSCTTSCCCCWHTVTASFSCRLKHPTNDQPRTPTPYFADLVDALIPIDAIKNENVKTTLVHQRLRLGHWIPVMNISTPILGGWFPFHSIRQTVPRIVYRASFFSKRPDFSRRVRIKWAGAKASQQSSDVRMSSGGRRGTDVLCCDVLFCASLV